MINQDAIHYNANDDTAINVTLAQKHVSAVVILAGGASTRMGAPKALLELPNEENLLQYHINDALKLGVPVFVADNEQKFSISYGGNADAGITNYVDDDSSNYLNQSDAPVIKVKDYQPSDCTENDDQQFSGPLAAILSGLLHSLKLNKIKTADAQKSQFSASNNDVTELHDKWMIVVSCDSLVSSTDIWHTINKRNTTIYRTTMPVDTKPVFRDKQVRSIHFNLQKTLGTVPIICLTDGLNTYPLLGLYQLRLAENLKYYLDAGNRKVMTFINPRCELIAMPTDWYGLCNLNTPDDFKQACDKVFKN